MSYNPPPPPPYNPSAGDVPLGPPPSKGRSHKGLIAAMLFAVSMVMLLCCVLVFAPSDDEDKGLDRIEQVQGTPETALGETGTPSPSPESSPEAVKPVPKAKPAPVVLEAGTYEVASKTDPEADTLAAGKWKIATPEDGINCYWATLRNLDGELTSIRSNGNVPAGSSATVNVKRTDAGLELLGECRATRK